MQLSSPYARPHAAPATLTAKTIHTDNRRRAQSIILPCLLLLLAACSNSNPQPRHETLVATGQGYPYAASYQGQYYFTLQTQAGTTLELYATSNLALINTQPDNPEKTNNRQPLHRVIISPNDTLTHIWSPEIHRINNHWYIYFEADNGNTDNHQLYVLEADGQDPMTAHFQLKPPINTCQDWNYGIHPTILQMPTALYLLWSGWPKRRAETETQCIYIAKMKNPWTLDGQRVMISKPDYEWERQWINPDGDRSAYPIYVNENPQAFISPDQQRVVLLYSASGIWTVYTAVGMLSAPANANLLDTAVWVKSTEPVLSATMLDDTCYANVQLLNDASDNSTIMLFEKKWRQQGNIMRNSNMRHIKWDEHHLPILP